MVLFQSSRNEFINQTFEWCCLTSGYAPNGGLMVPTKIPQISFIQLEKWKMLSFSDLCAEILNLFVGEEIILNELKRIARNAFYGFQSSEIIPFHQVGPYCVLEMFWGPTYSFKDVGIRIQAQFLNYFLSKRKEKVNVLISTSGDTGSAAISSLCGLTNINVYCLYPYKRVTRVQELQLTTVIESNVKVYRCHENNDIQDEVLLKIFKDKNYCLENTICSMNSTNIGRILTQCCHYFYAYLHIASKIGNEVDFAIPTGACGNSSGGTLAKSMGLPIGTIYLCTNANDLIHRIVSRGDFSLGKNIPTLSCAMDIQNSYNFERILYFLFKGDCRIINKIVKNLERKRRYTFSKSELTHLQWSLRSCSCNDINTIRIIRTLYKKFNYEICPQSAIGIYGVEYYKPLNPCVCIATAHPAKFDIAVYKSIEKAPTLTKKIKLLFQRKEKFTDLKIGPKFREQWLKQLKRDILNQRARL